MMKFNWDCSSFSKTYYLDRNHSQLKYKKKINIQKLVEQKKIPTYPVVTSKNSSLSLLVKTVEQGETPERMILENFIREKYHQVHQASVCEFSSTLFAGYAGAGIQVVIGMEHLSVAQAFLEQYLDQPIERILTQLSHAPVKRQNIVEIGNLAALDMEKAKLMVAFLVFHLSQMNIDWAVCTGTAAVRYVLQQMGLHFHVIEKANPEVLGEAKLQWGSYYQQKPYVLAIDVAAALQVTQQSYSFS
ncbi:thermostable hemolysin [Acinetobacter sp. BSP-28]|uniref:thermostable hemolysin n=1 Tax=Acinetobacter sp. BSP-28 TaxID=3344661 RepID=UPI00376F855B